MALTQGLDPHIDGCRVGISRRREYTTLSPDHTSAFLDLRRFWAITRGTEWSAGTMSGVKDTCEDTH